MSKALIIVDMQNDFITGALGSKEAQDIVDDIVKCAEKDFKHDRIIATMDTHDKDYLDTYEGKHLPIKHCIKNTPGWCLEDRIYNIKDLFTVEKRSFGSETLMHKLREDFFNLNTVYLCGVCTDICVISNALMIRSMLPEVKVVVFSNLCAGTTPEAHEAALKVMQSCQVEVIEWNLQEDKKKG